MKPPSRPSTWSRREATKERTEEAFAWMVLAEAKIATGYGEVLTNKEGGILHWFRCSFIWSTGIFPGIRLFLSHTQLLVFFFPTLSQLRQTCISDLFARKEKGLLIGLKPRGFRLKKAKSPDSEGARPWQGCEQRQGVHLEGRRRMDNGRILLVLRLLILVYLILGVWDGLFWCIDFWN